MIARVGLLRGLPASVLEECYAERVRLNPGARTLVATMTALGAETALVSGGFSFFSERVAQAAGFARHQANALLVADGVLTGEVARPILGRRAKLAALQALAAEAGVRAEAALAVGDGANDGDMVRAAGLGVAYHAKPALAAVADARIDHSDLTALLALQGIPEAEWRTTDGGAEARAARAPPGSRAQRPRPPAAPLRAFLGPLRRRVRGGLGRRRRRPPPRPLPRAAPA